MIRIEITASPDKGHLGTQITDAMEALGYYPVSHAGRVALDTGVAPVEPAGKQHAPEPEHDRPDHHETDGTVAPARQRGKPAPGRARRTKEEIAEDEAADRADAALNAGAKDAGIFGDAETVKPSISTGDERIGPEDDEATQAQDKADELAEVKAGAPTHDDLRGALGRYQKAFGMPAAVAAVQEGGLLGCTIDKVPADQIAAVLNKIDLAINSGAAPKTATSPQAQEAPAEPGPAPATREDVKTLMLAYQTKYGEAAVREDGPRIFKSALGEVPAGTKNAKGDVITNWVLSAIPDTPEAFAVCVKWWKTAINQAPDAFGRKPVA